MGLSTNNFNPVPLSSLATFHSMGHLASSHALIGLGENDEIHYQILNYVSITKKQFKNIEISTFIFIRGGPYSDVKYAFLFPIHNGV